MNAFEVETWPDAIFAIIILLLVISTIRWKKRHPYQFDITLHLKQEKEEDDDSGISERGD